MFGGICESGRKADGPKRRPKTGEKGRALEKWYFRDWQEETEIRVKKKKTKGKHVNLRWCVIFCDGISIKCGSWYERGRRRKC